MPIRAMPWRAAASPGREPDQARPPPLLGQKSPAIFVVENQYRLALLKVELAFGNKLPHRVTRTCWPVAQDASVNISHNGAAEQGIARVAGSGIR
jgi:hypothetical protein